MAQLDFPNSPTVGQQYAASNGAMYSWDGTVWASQAMGQACFIGVNPPPAPPTGEMWWRSDPDQNLYIYYDDGNSKQWVTAVSVPSFAGSPAGGTATVQITGGNAELSIMQNSSGWVRRGLQSYSGSALGVDMCVTFIGDTRYGTGIYFGLSNNNTSGNVQVVNIGNFGAFVIGSV
jgi:hypothetical protein